MKELTDDYLIAIARKAALDSTHRYSYMPAMLEDAAQWVPHRWVIEAMRALIDAHPVERQSNAWRIIDRKGKRHTVYHEGFAQAIAELGLTVTPMCDVPPSGWECSRDKGHDGPCAATEVTE